VRTTIHCVGNLDLNFDIPCRTRTKGEQFLSPSSILGNSFEYPVSLRQNDREVEYSQQLISRLSKNPRPPAYTLHSILY